MCSGRYHDERRRDPVRFTRRHDEAVFRWHLLETQSLAGGSCPVDVAGVWRWRRVRQGDRTAQRGLPRRDVANVELSALDDALSAKVRLSKGFGVAPQDAELLGKGRVESFPEADLVLYTAKLSLEPTAGGPCGSEPVSLALSLYRRGNAERVGGALTPYCGRDVWHGVPARAPLRITGKLPVPK